MVSTDAPFRFLLPATVAAATLLFLTTVALGTPLLGFLGLTAVVIAAMRLPDGARLRGALLGLAGATTAGALLPAAVFEYEATARTLDGFTTFGVATALALVALWATAELASRTLSVRA